MSLWQYRAPLKEDNIIIIIILLLMIIGVTAGVPQLVERQPQVPMDSMTRGSIKPHQGHKNKFVNFSKSEKLCWPAVGVPDLRVYKYNAHDTHVKDSVVHTQSSVDYWN